MSYTEYKYKFTRHTHTRTHTPTHTYTYTHAHTHKNLGVPKDAPYAQVAVTTSENDVEDKIGQERQNPKSNNSRKSILDCSV
jgi:hypothetical protein